MPTVRSTCERLFDQWENEVTFVRSVKDISSIEGVVPENGCFEALHHGPIVLLY